MNSQTLAHRFFHEPTARGEYAGVNVHFDFITYTGEQVWRFYSYSTCIAEIKQNRKGENVLVVADERYSTTTAKHRSELVRACPFPSDRILYVPRVSNSCYYTCRGMYDFERQLMSVINMSEKKLRHQEYRYFVQQTLRMFDEYAACMGDVPADLRKLRKSKKIANVVAMVEQKNQDLIERKRRIAQIPDEVREANRKKREAAIQRKLDKFLNSEDMLEKVRIAYSMSVGCRRDYSDEYRDAIAQYRKVLQKARDKQGRLLSYVWIDKGQQHVSTSQHCDAPITDVIRLCRLWKAHQSMVGQKAGIYTVLENTDEVVKVGCHVIPAWNVEALCKQLNVK